MALILVDGFEDLSSWTLAGAATFTATGARHGSAASLSGGTGVATYLIPTAQESATVTVGAAFKFSGSSANLISLCSDASFTSHLDVFLNTSGGIDVKRGATVLASTAISIMSNGVWKYIEFQATLSDTVGAFTLRMDGVQLLALSGQDTKNAGTKTTFDSVKVGCTGGAGTPTTMVDDLYLMAGVGDSFLGDCTVETLYPNGNGNANVWVGSDADSTNNYLLVNEVGAPVTTSYTGSAVTGQQDMYTMTDLVATAGTILGVCHQAYAIKTDSGLKQLKLVNRRAADTKSAALDLTQTYAPFHYVLATDPEGGAWTFANVNALQSGIEVV